MCAATSWPTSATSSRRRSGRCRCWRRRSSRAATIRRPWSTSPTRMIAETQRLTTLIKDLMDLSRLEGDRPAAPDGAGGGRRGRRAGLRRRQPARHTARTSRFLRGGVTGLKVQGVRVPARHRPAQPDRQRHQLQRRVDQGRGDHWDHRGHRDDRGDRPGHRHPAARARPDLRALLPGRPRPLARHRWHRARAGHRQARLRQPRRRLRGLVAGRARARPSPSGCPSSPPPARKRPAKRGHHLPEEES